MNIPVFFDSGATRDGYLEWQKYVPPHYLPGEDDPAVEALRLKEAQLATAYLRMREMHKQTVTPLGLALLELISGAMAFLLPVGSLYAVIRWVSWPAFSGVGGCVILFFIAAAACGYVGIVGDLLLHKIGSIFVGNHSD